MVLAMTTRIIPILGVAILIGPSLAYGSPACMTKSEARAKFPKELFIRTNIAGTTVRQCSCIRYDPQSRQCPCLLRDQHSRQSPRLPHDPKWSAATPMSQECNVDIRHVSSRSSQLPVQQ